MRLHRLELTAFGPFRDRQEVDFDGLSAAGLFLLHGATGAGKTSVLDAICYALYGRVPGTRATTNALRSHYAADGDQPEVVVEFSVAERRFSVRRSPAWERPKKRGSGMTTVPARVQVTELLAGEWQIRSTRLDEAAHLLEDVLGMGPEQFTKLVLLPQGEFAAFLGADADQRRALLERIFATDRFAGVADWLREERARQRHEVDQLDHITHSWLARAEQAAALALGAVVSAAPGPSANSAGNATTSDPVDSSPEAYVSRLISAVESLRQQAMIEHHEACQAADAAEMNRDQSEAIGALAAEHAALRMRQTTAAQRQNAIHALDQRLTVARRAQAVSGWTTQVAAARRRAQQAAAQLAQEAAALQPALPDDEDLPEAESWRRELDHVVRALNLLEALRPDIERSDQLHASQQQAEQTVEQLHQRLAEATSAGETAHATLAIVSTELEVALSAAASLEPARAVMSEAVRRAEAARDAHRAEAQLTTLRGDLSAAREASIRAREFYLDCREHRLRSIAAELAHGLVEGEPCRVCGATEHPQRATAEPAAVDAAQEDAARLRAESAADQVTTVAANLAAGESTLAAAVKASAGWTTDEAQSALTEAAAAVAVAEAAHENAVTLKQRVEAVAETAADAERERARLSAAVTTAEQELAVVRSQREQVLQRLEQARGEHHDLGARVRSLHERRDHLQRALTAAEVAQSAAARWAELRAAADQVAAEAGFADLASAEAALLDPESLTRIEREVIDHSVEVESVDEQLAEERFATLSALNRAVPTAEELAVLREQALEASLRQDRAKDQARRCDDAGKSLAAIDAQLRSHLTAAAPLRADYEALDDLVRCLDGTGGDNSLRMSLPSYVLAARLEQVASAATLRLAQMSGGRYALAHTDSTAKGRGRSGLSLEVIDAWTGVRRQTATLSGGEAFYTSLALALGLADVVAAEAGGIRMDTLFIDEGFGSLDEDTLEEVMDTLDGLRSGGRAVGIVSHLAELRQRIGTRLEVTKSERGSRLTLAS